MSQYTIYKGDCLEVLRTFKDNSIDSIVTDPPYGLKFMGKKWDYDVPAVEVWAECLRVLKPGGHLLAFAGTRTQHRMAVRIEDAGFEIRDMIAWVYGSGFPKSKNLSDDWQGWGTALKPALEPITVARKPLIGTVAENVLEHGTGALNIDGCRIEGRERTDYGLANSTRSKGSTYGEPSASADFDSSKGRWPANLIHDGSEEVVALFPQSEVSGSAKKGSRSEATPEGIFGKLAQGRLHNDTGSAARFFYCAKASRKDRNEGLPSSKEPAVGTGATMREIEDANWSKRNGNHHPTVKPTDLCRYLLRLVTPPGGKTLDLYAGSGSFGKAAILEGFYPILIEKDEDDNGNPLGYIDIIRARCDNAVEAMNPKPKVDVKSSPNLDLFEHVCAGSIPEPNGKEAA